MACRFPTTSTHRVQRWRESIESVIDFYVGFLTNKTSADIQMPKV